MVLRGRHNTVKQARELNERERKIEIDRWIDR